MERSHKAYGHLLLHRKSRRSFSATTAVPRETWRGFLEAALNPIWHIGARLPAAGGFSNYDILLLAQRLSGIRRGFYHLSGSNNGAVRLKKIGLAMEPIQEYVRWAITGGSSQATLILIARGTKIRGKYGKKRGSELLFQNIGVVQFHLYLTATAWGLGGCAVGWVEPHVFGKSIQLRRGDAVVAFTFGL
jgi:SagB-type dehydrogenase family enzyme